MKSYVLILLLVAGCRWEPPSSAESKAYECGYMAAIKDGLREKGARIDLRSNCKDFTAEHDKFYRESYKSGS